jgi:EAL domain-containing protein (putative c-di-GMP-specific phosphodiesterase class I)
VASVADKIIQDFTGVFELNGVEVYVSASIGISIFPEDGKSASELLKHADIAMYRAKDFGRNRYQFFTQAMNDKLHHHQEIALQLRASIEKQDFQLFYQPQIDLHTGAIVSCEALIRWFPHGRRMIAPAEFISVAEKSNLINRIGALVIEEVCRQKAEWKRKGLKDTRIDINLSGRQFFLHELWDVFRSALAKHGLSPPDIGVELTEHILIQSDKETLYALQEMHDAGVHIAIDDFGTGYSSLSYLKRFPVNSLKIDREFVRDAPEDKNDRAIMEAIVAMGHNLGLKVLLEGIETEEQRLLSLAIQCDLAQGFFFHRPMAAEKIQALLSP